MACAISGPTMSATKLQIHEPKRKMHRKHENAKKTIENQPFQPSKQPLWSLPGAIRDPHGALLAPKQPSQSLCSQEICAAKLKIHEPTRKMHGKPESNINTNENQYFAFS